MKKTLFCLFSGLLLTWNGAAQDNIYVVPPGTTGINPDDPYTNWATASTNIQAAIDVAKTRPGHNTIIVSNGVYNLSDELYIDFGVTLRSWNHGMLDRTNTLVVGGDGFRCVYLAHADAVLSGFTLTNGSPAGTGGGGVFLHSGTVSNCIITGNSSDERGGGIRQLNGTIVDCDIVGNIAHTSGNEKGGGVWGNGGEIRNSRIMYNVITNVTSWPRGAGIYVRGPYSIIGCEIVGNTNFGIGGTGGAGGGIYIGHTSGHVIISNSLIRGNYTTSQGSGLLLRGSNIRIYNTDISGNTALSQGGGFSTVTSYEAHTNVMLINCTIKDNTGSLGGGGYSYFELSLKNCLIAGNSGASGGGLYLRSSLENLINCTIADNSATIEGGGIWLHADVAGHFYNAIIYDNTRDGSPDDIYLGDIQATNYFFHSCAGTMVLPPGQGNISEDPQFVGGNDFRLKANSPCVNAGTNQNWMTNAVDLDGYPRIDRHNRRVDMGCYERVTRGSVYLFW